MVLGARLILNSGASVQTWAYRRFTEEEPLVTSIIDEFGLDNPHEGNIVAEIGSYVVGIHNKIGNFKVSNADSMNEGKSTAENAGYVTVCFGVLFVAIAGVRGGGVKEGLIKIRMDIITIAE